MHLRNYHMIRKRLLLALVGLLLGLSNTSQSNAQIFGGHRASSTIHSGVGHTFGGYNSVPVYQYQEPLAGAQPAAAPAFSGYLQEPVLSARTVTSAGNWPAGVSQPPVPINYSTTGPNPQRFYGWNSFWWYDPSQGSPIWNSYNRGHY